jgi:mRNA interferase YafQ
VINLVWYKSFARAFKKTIKKNPELKEKLREALELLVNDPFHPVLGTHKLSMKLKGYHAFSLGTISGWLLNLSTEKK